MSPRYVCRECGQDLTEAVARERQQELDVLRFRKSKAKAEIEWSVRVFCDEEHENVFSGSGDG